MRNVTLKLSEEKYEALVQRAQEAEMSISAYAQSVLFSPKSIYNCTEAFHRAMERHKADPENFTVFCLPDLYPEWDLQRGAAGAFGRAWRRFLSQRSSKLGKSEIVFDKNIVHGTGIRAQYRFTS